MSPITHGLSLSRPLTQRTLAYIRSLLPPLTGTFSGGQTPAAAVLIPLCNVRNRPCLLFEVRGNTRLHAGEVCFPGGGVDAEDQSPVAAAVREMEEEIGIPRSFVQVLGTLTPPEISLRGKRVYPFVGYVHALPARQRDSLGEQAESWDQLPSDGAVLPSLQLQSLVLSPHEVTTLFAVPLQSLVSKSRCDVPVDGDVSLTPSLFRSIPWKPYYTVNVARSSVDGKGLGERDMRTCGKWRIWGLTGWYLNLLMRALGIWNVPSAD